jgi:hypothetical protein
VLRESVRCCAGELVSHQTSLLPTHFREQPNLTIYRRKIKKYFQPDNLFLVSDPLIFGGQRVKLLDFGLAKLLGDEVRRTTDGSILGTPLYMPPEQWQGGQRLGIKSDVYALGALFFELLIGRPPFHASTPSELMYQHINRQAPLLSELAHEVPPRLEGLLAVMLAKEPATRPRMEDVVAVLDPLRAEVDGRGPLTLHGGEPVTIGDSGGDGMSETLGAELQSATKLAVTKGNVATAQSPKLALERQSPVSLGASPPEAARSTSLSALSVSLPTPPPRRLFWPIVAMGTAGLLLMTVLALTLLRPNSPQRSIPSAASSAPIPAVAVPITPPAVAEQTKPVTETQPEESKVQHTQPAKSGEKTVTEPTRDTGKRKRRSSIGPSKPSASEPKAEDPMGVFREH